MDNYKSHILTLHSEQNFDFLFSSRKFQHCHIYSAEGRRMNVNMRHGRNDRGNPKYRGRNLAQCHSVHHKSHKDCPKTTKFPSLLEPTVTQFIPSQTTALLTYLLTYTLTQSLTPCNRVLLQKLTGFQLVKKFPPCHGTRRFITAFTSARHFAYPEPAPSSPYPIARLSQ